MKRIGRTHARRPMVRRWWINRLRRWVVAEMLRSDSKVLHLAHVGKSQVVEWEIRLVNMQRLDAVNQAMQQGGSPRGVAAAGRGRS